MFSLAVMSRVTDERAIAALIGLNAATDEELEAIISHSLPGHPDVHAMTDAELQAIAYG